MVRHKPTHFPGAAVRGAGALAGHSAGGLHFDGPDVRAPRRACSDAMAHLGAHSRAGACHGCRRSALAGLRARMPACMRLIDKALANNRDLRVAVLSIEQARAQYQIRSADQTPTVNLAATGNAPACIGRRHQQHLHRRPGAHRLGD